eukprot:1588555-Prymnesium_polylepis.1
MLVERAEETGALRAAVQSVQEALSNSRGRAEELEEENDELLVRPKPTHPQAATPHSRAATPP